MSKGAERNDSFQVLGLTRTDKSAKKLLKSIKFPSDATNSVDVQTCDITDPNALAASLKDAPIIANLLTGILEPNFNAINNVNSREIAN